MHTRLFQAEETAAEERAIEARSMPVWLEGKSGDVRSGTRSATTLTVFKSALADLFSGSTVLLGSDTGASSKLGPVSGFFWRGR